VTKFTLSNRSRGGDHDHQGEHSNVAETNGFVAVHRLEQGQPSDLFWLVGLASCVGSMVQLAALNTMTSHAAVSRWKGLNGLNQHHHLG
jgi:N-acetyl-anhydromuramyl-L-alanine amidase AmpD